MSDNFSSTIEPVQFTPETTQTTLVLGISIVLFSAAVELVRRGVPQAWLLVGLFGLSIFACLMTLLPGACLIEIDETGLKVVSRFRETVYRWDQIERIGIYEVGIIRRIGIDLNKSYPGPERVPNYMKPASGYHVSLPIMKGIELEELLDVLQRCLLATS